MKRFFRISLLTICFLGIAQPCPYFLANTLQRKPCASMGGMTPCDKDAKQCAKRTSDQQTPGHPGARELTLLHCVPEDYSSKAPQPIVPVCLVFFDSPPPTIIVTIDLQDLISPIPVGREILNLNLRI